MTTNHNILLHYLLHQYVPNINSYEHYLKSQTEFIFNPNEINNIDFINSHFVNSFLQKNKFQALYELSNNGFKTKFLEHISGCGIIQGKSMRFSILIL